MKALEYFAGITRVLIGFFILLPVICWFSYIYSISLSLLTIDLFGLEGLAYKTHYSASGSIEYEHTPLVWFLVTVYLIGTALFFWKLGAKAKARNRGAIVVLAGLVWGGVIIWIILLLFESRDFNPLTQYIIFFTGALPYAVSGYLGEYLPKQYIDFDLDDSLSLREQRGMLYLFFSPQIFGVLLTYSISKIYERVRK